MALPRSAMLNSAAVPLFLAAALFCSAGRYDLTAFWLYIALLSGAFTAGMLLLDEDLLSGTQAAGWQKAA